MKSCLKTADVKCDHVKVCGKTERGKRLDLHILTEPAGLEPLPHLLGCRNIYSRIVYSRTIYPNIFTLRLNYSLGILPHGILILKYFYSVEI